MPNILKILIASKKASDKRVIVHADNPRESFNPIIEVEIVKNENSTKEPTTSLHDGLKQLDIRLLWKIPAGLAEPKNQTRRITSILLIKNRGHINKIIVMIIN